MLFVKSLRLWACSRPRLDEASIRSLRSSIWLSFSGGGSDVPPVAVGDRSGSRKQGRERLGGVGVNRYEPARVDGGHEPLQIRDRRMPRGVGLDQWHPCSHELLLQPSTGGLVQIPGP